MPSSVFPIHLRDVIELDKSLIVTRNSLSDITLARLVGKGHWGLYVSHSLSELFKWVSGHFWCFLLLRYEDCVGKAFLSLFFLQLLNLLLPRFCKITERLATDLFLSASDQL
jgi:hypothetical protein